MTETQAKSGSAGTSTNPVDEDAATGGGGAPPTGRAAVGRAAVPADAPSPKFTRAPGMPPPPDQLPGDPGGAATPAARDGADSAPAPGGSAAPASASAGTSAVATSRADQAASPTRPDQPAAASRLEQPATPPGTPGRAEQSSAPGRAGQPPQTGSNPPGPGPQTAHEASRAGAGTQSGPGVGRSGGAPQPAGPGRFGFGGPTRAAGGAGAVGAARVTDAVRAARSTVSSAASRGPRRARLNLKRIDPWSVMKFSFAVSLVLFIVVIVATSVLYLALDAMGVFDSVNGTLTDMISASGGQSGSTFKITARGVILTSGLIGLVNVVLFTALATLGAFIFNVCADLVGGIELTLAERD